MNKGRGLWKSSDFLLSFVLQHFSLLQAAISTKLVPRVLIAVYEAHLLAQESVLVWCGIQ